MRRISLFRLRWTGSFKVYMSSCAFVRDVHKSPILDLRFIRTYLSNQKDKCHSSPIFNNTTLHRCIFKSTSSQLIQSSPLSTNIKGTNKKFEQKEVRLKRFYSLFEHVSYFTLLFCSGNSCFQSMILKYFNCIKNMFWNRWWLKESVNSWNSFNALCSILWYKWVVTSSSPFSTMLVEMFEEGHEKCVNQS